MFYLRSLICRLKRIVLPAAAFAAGLAAAVLVCTAAVCAAVDSLNSGQGFAGVKVGVVSSEEDGNTRLLLRLLEGMDDIGRYADFEFFGDISSALELLGDEKLDAVIELPPDFTDAVMDGRNFAPRVVLNAGRPLESGLTYWLVRSAADMLSSAQGGIYVLLAEARAQRPQEYAAELEDINFEYINWTLGRSGMYSRLSVLPTGGLPVDVHYALNWAVMLSMLLSGVWAAYFSPASPQEIMRLRSFKKSPAADRLCHLAAAFVGIFAVCFAAALVLAAVFGGSLFSAALGGGLWAVFLTCFFALFARAGSSGIFAAALAAAVFAFISGGIIPPALLPQILADIAPFTPVAALTGVLRTAAGYEAVPYAAAVVLAWCALMLPFCLKGGKK